MINLVKSASNRVFHRRSSMGSSSSSGELTTVPADARRKAAKYVERCRWNKLRDLLHAIERAESTLPVGIDCAARCGGRRRGQGHNLAESDAEDDGGGTFLHFLCRFRPPVDIVRTTVRLFPEMVMSTDKSSRVPLHFAVDFGAPLDVVEALVQYDEECAAAQDIDGKTPLMLACEEIGRQTNFDVFVDSSKIAHLSCVIEVLARLCPDTVALEDNEGRTALEHALDGEAPETTIRCLQRATIEHATGGNTNCADKLPKHIEFHVDISKTNMENHEQQRRRSSDISSLASVPRRSSSSCQISTAAA